VGRAHDRDLARVIARRLALLVRALMLFVDDDRTEVRERREDRRARADRDALASVLEREPLVVSLAVAEGTVQYRDLVAEDSAKAIDGLRRERDLRHQDDRRLISLDHDAPEQLDVDERLAAARDAVQQENIAAASSRQRVDRRALCRRWRVRR